RNEESLGIPDPLSKTENSTSPEDRWAVGVAAIADAGDAANSPAARPRAAEVTAYRRAFTLR
ncbi:hypothetical protein, partial [Streptomyces roseoverticillatus]